MVSIYQNLEKIGLLPLLALELGCFSQNFYFSRAFIKFPYVDQNNPFQRNKTTEILSFTSLFTSRCPEFNSKFIFPNNLFFRDVISFTV